MDGWTNKGAGWGMGADDCQRHRHADAKLVHIQLYGTRGQIFRTLLAKSTMSTTAHLAAAEAVLRWRQTRGQPSATAVANSTRAGAAMCAAGTRQARRASPAGSA
eukprot:352336-Chlamydomonas_euryale.AAC.1